MSQIDRKFRRAGTVAVCFAAATLAITTAARAEDVYVKDGATVLDDSSVAGGKVATVDKGAALHVISRQGNWIQVQFSDAQGHPLQGYVSTDDVSSKKPDAGLGDLFAGGNADTSGATASAAGKGLGDRPTVWANNLHLNKDMVIHIEEVRNSIKKADLLAFENSPEGKLGKD